MFIGFYNKSIILTFIGLFCSIFGMYFCLNNNINIALILFLISGICDSFDGYIASLIKRTKDEKKYGIQLDSLVDVVCFGVFPIIISLSFGYNNYYNLIIYCIYIFCWITRLAYFNIDEQQKENFRGVPITTASFAFPILLFFTTNEIILMTAFIILSLLFILNIKVKKFNLKERKLYSLCVVVILLIILWRYFLWKKQDCFCYFFLILY